MSVMEKAAYLKGLAEGLDIPSDTAEGKLLLALVDAFGELAAEVDGIGDEVDELSEVVDEIDEDLGEVEEELYSFDEDFEDDTDDFEDDFNDDFDDDSEDDPFEGALYEVTCANCGDKIYLDDSNLREGSMECPTCGKLLEFTYDDSDEFDEDDTEDPE